MTDLTSEQLDALEAQARIGEPMDDWEYFRLAGVVVELLPDLIAAARELQRLKMQSRKVITFLWDLLDNIDTADDAAKGDDSTYRAMARRQQKRRWETGITTDGYELDLSAVLGDMTPCPHEAERDQARAVLADYRREADMVPAEELRAVVADMKQGATEISIRHGVTFDGLMDRLDALLPEHRDPAKHADTAAGKLAKLRERLAAKADHLDSLRGPMQAVVATLLRALLEESE